MLKHVPGSKMEKADSLSKRSDWEVEVERDNKNKTLVKLEWLKVKKNRGSRNHSRRSKPTRKGQAIKCER